MKRPEWWPGPRQLHKLLAYVWIALIIPAALWWKDAVWYVAAMSQYANIASEMAASHAAGLSEADKEWIREAIREELARGRAQANGPSSGSSHLPGGPSPGGDVPHL